MSDITIPPAALEAGALATLEELDAIAGLIGATRVDGELTPEQQEFFRRIARTAFLAMIEAWQGMECNGPSGGGVSQEPLQPSRIILPLPPQENSDE